VALGLGITLLVYLQAEFALVPLPVRLDPIALRLADWDGLAARIADVQRQEGADFVAADQYGVAAELALAMPAGVPVVGAEPRWALFDLPHPTLAGRTGILVRNARRGDLDDRARWSEITEIGAAERRDAGRTVESFRLFRVTGWDNTGPVALLPRPR
jgi:hypothetical protein